METPARRARWPGGVTRASVKSRGLAGWQGAWPHISPIAGAAARREHDASSRLRFCRKRSAATGGAVGQKRPPRLLFAAHGVLWPWEGRRGAISPEPTGRSCAAPPATAETGELRDSIEWTAPIRENATTVSGYVGSNNPKAEWHEFGTSRIPPRPFLGPAAMGAEKELHAIAQREVAKAFAGGKHYHELREIFHAAEKAWHATNELVESIGEDEDEK